MQPWPWQFISQTYTTFVCTSTYETTGFPKFNPKYSNEKKGITISDAIENRIREPGSDIMYSVHTVRDIN